MALHSLLIEKYLQHLRNGSKIKCNKVLLNDGNQYSIFTRIFTVPQTGVYLLTFNFGVQYVDDWTEVRLVVNNRDIVGAVVEVKGQSSTERKTSGNTAIVNLIQGDFVW